MSSLLKRSNGVCYISPEIEEWSLYSDAEPLSILIASGGRPRFIMIENSIMEHNVIVTVSRPVPEFGVISFTRSSKYRCRLLAL